MKNLLKHIYPLVFLFLLLDSCWALTPMNLKTNKPIIKIKPVNFLENKGQMVDMNNHAVPHVFFKAESPGLDLYITNQGLSYVFLNYIKVAENINGEETEDGIKVKWEKMDVILKGATIRKENILKEFPSEHHFNYFYEHCPKGIFNVKEYRKIIIKEVYPGIDWVLYNSSENGFKYDFIVHPGADYSVIKLVYSTNKAIALNFNGDLQVENNFGVLTENKPFTYLQENKQKIKSQFKVEARSKKKGRYETIIGFDIEESSNKNLNTLVIDPQLVWTTFFGGGGVDGTYSIKTDINGNVFACGYTTSANLPTLNSGTYFSSTLSGNFILKFDNSGVLLWGTHFAGNQTSVKLETDNVGNLFAVGGTVDPAFPVMNASTYFQGSLAGNYDAFITKFDNSGNLLWSTYYGGTGYDVASSITIDNTGNVFVSGITTSTNFPVQNYGTFFQGGITGNSSGFMLKFDNNGNRLWATFYAGIDGLAMATDLNGNVYATGSSTLSTMSLMNPGSSAYYQSVLSGTVDAYIIKFDNLGNQLWSTFYGGSSSDKGTSIVSDNIGNIFVMGITTSSNLPVQNAGTFFQGVIGFTSATSYDIFVLKFNPSGVRLWGTYFGGTGSDYVSTWNNLAMDSCNNLHLSFFTTSPNLPTMMACEGGFYTDSLHSNYNDIFLTRFSNSGMLLWATYFGGDGTDFRSALDIDANNNLFVTGEWNNASANLASYPLVNPGNGAMNNIPNLSDEVFFAKFTRQLPNNQSFAYGTMCQGYPGFFPIHSAGYIPGGQYTASPGLSVNITTGELNSSTTSPGTYTVTYSLNSVTCSCSPPINFTINALVNIIPSPSISISGNTVVCFGSSITLTASASSNYTWSNGSNNVSITETPTISTIYGLTTTASNGCRGYTSTPVIVHDLPSLSVLGTKTICLGNLTTLTVSGASTYTWSSGNNSSTLSLSPTITTTYSVSGTNTNGCASTSTTQVNVNKCTGLDETMELINGLKIYPNPSNGEFSIESDLDINLDLVDELGQTIRRLQLSQHNKRKITVREIAKGIYYLKGYYGSQRVNYKLVVN